MITGGGQLPPCPPLGTALLYLTKMLTPTISSAATGFYKKKYKNF